jgi:hypothetical protein
VENITKNYSLKTINGKSTPHYSRWRDMKTRCYNEKAQKRDVVYQNVIVCDEWHDFQVFAEWFEQNYNPETMKGWQLDKDILVKNNKIYSPDRCCFVPKEINVLFTKRKSKRGDFPIGVTYHSRDLKFMARIIKYGKVYHLGYFDTAQKAFQVYKVAKEDYIKEVAEKWKDKITLNVYNALINYKVEITD